jgi:hypothetical protein
VNGTALRGVPAPERRKVERPSYEQLMADVASMSLLAMGHKCQTAAAAGVHSGGVIPYDPWRGRACRRDPRRGAGYADALRDAEVAP